MNRIELIKTIHDLYSYFRLKDPCTSEQIDLWLKDLQYIDSKALGFISEKMKEFDNLPRNLPKFIKGFYAQHRRQNQGTAFIKYDTYDDPRFPIQKLHEATEILINSGQDSFLEYCHTHYMPAQDIERCRNKALRVIDKYDNDMLEGVR